MSEPPKEKTEWQINKERANLSRIRLCHHNLRGWGYCNPPSGKQCNFAHWLSDLTVPEEWRGDRSKVWQGARVDMRFWYDYRPNQQSLDRFTQQFNWERRWYPGYIPNWAWGRAVDLQLCTREDVPAHVPKDFEWNALQEAWRRGKNSGGTAMAVMEDKEASSKHVCEQADSRMVLGPQS